MLRLMAVAIAIFHMLVVGLTAPFDESIIAS